MLCVDTDFDLDYEALATPGLQYFIVGLKEADGPFLAFVLKLPEGVIVDDADFMHYDDDPSEGIKLEFFVLTDGGGSWGWNPVDHIDFHYMRLFSYIDSAEEEDPCPKADDVLLLRQLTKEEYETLIAFDREGPSSERIDVEYVEWTHTSK